MFLGLLRFAHSTSDRESDPAAGIFRILLIKQSERLGNVILLNSAIDSISKRFPLAKIDLLLPAAFSDLLADNPRIERIIPVYKRTYITRPWKLVFLLKNLRNSAYDLAIDCSDVNTHSLTGAIYTLLCGSRTTAGWRMSEMRIFDIEIPKYSKTVHATEMYLRLISGIFQMEMRGEPFFRIINNSANSADPVIGINCGGRGDKRWALENFIELGNLLSTAGIKSEFILGPEEDKQRAILQHRLPEKAVLLPFTPLPELKRLIRRYAVFVSSDTGPMHLAWSLGVPTLAIFIDSELEKFKPLSPGSLALDARDGLSPQAVFECALKILNSQRIPA